METLVSVRRIPKARTRGRFVKKGVVIKMIKGISQIAGGYKRNRFLIVIAVLSILIFFGPNYRRGLIEGSDSPFHLARIDSLAQDLSKGIFPVKVHTELGYDYGYGVGLFYQNHFLYLPAFLRLMGCSLEVSYKIYLFFIVSAVYLSAFYSAFCISGDKYGASIAAICYLFSHQFISSCYEHFTIGSSVGMIFMPLAVVGMERFLIKDKSPVLLGIGFWGAVCGHTLTAYMAFAVCLLLLIAHVEYLWKNPKKIGYLFITVGAVLALTISYWLPMWEAFRVQGYKVSRSWTIPEENVVNIWSLIGSGGIGWPLFFWLLIIFFFLAEKKGCKEYRLICTQFIIVLVLMALQTIQSFWVITRPITQMMQFPKRLLIPTTVLLVLCAALAVKASGISDNWKKILVVLNFVAAVYFGIGMINGLNMEDRTAEYSERIIYEEIAGFGAGEEWLPVETTREMLNDLNQAVADDGTTVSGEKAEGCFRFTADAGKKYYDVPFIYYRGYGAMAEDGSRLEVDKNPETSMVRVFMPEDGTGAEGMEVIVRYKGTVLQKLSYMINTMAVAAMIGAAVWYYRKKRKTAQGR